MSLTSVTITIFALTFTAAPLAGIASLVSAVHHDWLGTSAGLVAMVASGISAALMKNEANYRRWW